MSYIGVEGFFGILIWYPALTKLAVRPVNSFSVTAMASGSLCRKSHSAFLRYCLTFGRSGYPGTTFAKNSGPMSFLQPRRYDSPWPFSGVQVFTPV